MTTTPVAPQDLTIAALTTAVDDVVAEVGEAYGGTPCRYVNDGHPCCLLGRVFYRLGVADIPTMIEWDSEGSNANAENVLLQLEATPAVAVFAGQLQMANDEDVEWGLIRDWAREAQESGASFSDVRNLRTSDDDYDHH